MMAPRKDIMRIIRQDAGFSAKLGFGGPGPVSVDETKGSAATHPAMAESPELAGSKSLVAVVSPSDQDRCVADEHQPLPIGSAKAETANNPTTAAKSAARGHVIYVAVSLTSRQAALAEVWAGTARCSVQFLIRRVAQGLRDEVFEEWALRGMPDVDEPRGLRGKHPTSVTMTLRPDFAAELSRRHDPLEVLGLARIMGPAFRARFQVAFDQALANAKVQTADEGAAE